MNACQEGQVSGNRWARYSSAMLHQDSQESRVPPQPPQGLEVPDALEQQMRDLAVQHEATLREVRRHFVLPSNSSVATFLTEHRTLSQILLEASRPLRECFGAETVFNLRAPTDESGSRTLYAVTMWPGSLREVREALAKFDDRWWVARSQQASGRLIFTYELV